MPEFDVRNGSCFAAISYAMDEARAKGIEMRTQAWYDYIAERKYEIWRELEDKTYNFSAAVRI